MNLLLNWCDVKGHGLIANNQHRHGNRNWPPCITDYFPSTAHSKCFLAQFLNTTTSLSGFGPHPHVPWPQTWAGKDRCVSPPVACCLLSRFAVCLTSDWSKAACSLNHTSPTALRRTNTTAHADVVFFILLSLSVTVVTSDHGVSKALTRCSSSHPSFSGDESVCRVSMTELLYTGLFFFSFQIDMFPSLVVVLCALIIKALSVHWLSTNIRSDVSMHQ